MSTVIIVENLGKKYLLSHQSQRQPYVALRDVIAERAIAVGRRLLHHFHPSPSTLHPSQEEFWALIDVSFEVKQGDRIGIIGRNGAGKSTLLKILSRITEPTTGRVRIKGRVASLLEVGTGFHPELTGRENIFLNGAILGMTRAEIKKKFDEIVDFAEIEKFLDTPVKRYSSGMYVRLAFAIAAHLEPEILVVDEVLAVGDAQFQKKCLGKMEDVSAKEGRTVLFVSHNMGLVQQLCNIGICIQGGKILHRGSISDAVQHYLNLGQVCDTNAIDLAEHPNRLAGMKHILHRISLADGTGSLTREFTQLDVIRMKIEYGARDTVSLAGAGFIVYTQEGVRVGGGNTYMSFAPPHRIPVTGEINFVIPARQFTPGKYLLTVSLGSHQGALEDKVEHAISFTIDQADVYGTGYLLTKEDGVAALTFQAEIVEHSGIRGC
jgi:lipopolysaccharide transport system ATP-binding protein